VITGTGGSGFTATAKASGVIVLPIAIAYFLITYLLFTPSKKESALKLWSMIKTKKGIIISLGIIVVLVLLRGTLYSLYFISKTFLKNFTLDYASGTLQLVPHLIGWFGIIFFIAAIILALIYKTRELIIITITQLLFLISAVFFFTQVPELRYILPIVPPTFLLVGYVADEIIKMISMVAKVQRKYITITLQVLFLIILFFAVIKPEYTMATQNIEGRNHFYKGYIEAMNWVSENIQVEPGQQYISNFFACCNYNVGLESDKVVRVNSTAIFGTYEDFTDFLDRNPDMTIYLMPDLWEPGQRSWLYPMSQEKFNNIQSLGFQLVKIVERPFPTQQGLQNIPVIFIFRKN